MKISQDIDEARELFKQIELGRKLLTIETELLDAAKRDSRLTPTDELLAQRLSITVEEVKELREFAHNDLGEVEADLINSGVSYYTNMEGKITGKGGYEEDGDEERI